MDKNFIQNKNILLSLPIKSISIVLNFVLVPLLINFLGKSSYGVWITVISIANWVITFDLGIGQGLRNKMTEAFTAKNTKKASSVLSTAFFSVTILSFGIMFIGTFLIYFLDFQKLLNFPKESNQYLQKFIFISLLFTLLNFILSLYKKIYLSIHKSYFVESINVIFLTFYFVFILSWDYLGIDKNLIPLMILYGSLNVLVSYFALILFLKLNGDMKISIQLVNKKDFKSLFGLSFKFFVINLSLLVILSTDNIIIASLLGPSQVTDYNTIQRIFHLIIVSFTLVLTPSWSLYSQSLAQGDYKWISKNLRRMNFYFILPVLMGLFLFFKRKEILEYWIGEEIISEPKYLSLGFFIYALIFCYTNIYNFFINASNKIGLQMRLYLIGAIINIPLSIFFVKWLGTSTGVIIATILSSIPLLLAMPIQTKLVLDHRRN